MTALTRRQTYPQQSHDLGQIHHPLRLHPAVRSNSSSGTRRPPRIAEISSVVPVALAIKSPPAASRLISTQDTRWFSTTPSFVSGSGSSSGNQFFLLTPPSPGYPSSPFLVVPSRCATPDLDFPFRRVDADPLYQRIRLNGQARKTSYFDMASPANMKRKVVILGSPSVGEYGS
jgi:hypothetical protein